MQLGGQEYSRLRPACAVRLAPIGLAPARGGDRLYCPSPRACLPRHMPPRSRAITATQPPTTSHDTQVTRLKRAWGDDRPPRPGRTVKVLALVTVQADVDQTSEMTGESIRVGR